MAVREELHNLRPPYLAPEGAAGPGTELGLGRLTVPAPITILPSLGGMPAERPVGLALPASAQALTAVLPWQPRPRRGRR